MPTLKIAVTVPTLLLLGAASIWILTRNAATTPAPKIQFEALHADFGDSIQGSVLSHKFKFTNTGEDALRIIDVKTPCDCTTALISADAIDPGSSGEIEVSVDTVRLGGIFTPEPVDDPAPFVRQVVVVTNDPVMPEVVLDLTGTVHQEFFHDPVIDFGAVNRGQEVRRQVVIQVRARKDVRLLSVTSTSEHVHATLQPTGKPDARAFALVATLQATATADWLSGNVLITTSSPQMPVLNIPLRAVIGQN